MPASCRCWLHARFVGQLVFLFHWKDQMLDVKMIFCDHQNPSRRKTTSKTISKTLQKLGIEYEEDMVWTISFGPYDIGHVVSDSIWKICFDTILWSLFSGRQESTKPLRPIICDWSICKKRNFCKGMNDKKVDFKDENVLLYGLFWILDSNHSKISKYVLIFF